jgi:hypothetical protein
MTHSTPESPQGGRPPVETETDLRIVRRSTVILVVVVVVGLFLMREFLGFLTSREVPREPTPARRLSQPSAMREPDLNPEQPAELAKLRAQSEKTLASYGWVDRQKKVARIPVARAMELLLERGLPVRKQPEEESTQ